MEMQAETQEAPAKTGGAEMLLCRSHVKSYVLRRARELRTVWHPERVSDEAIEMLEYRLRVMIDRSIRSHPTKGKTFSQVI